MVTTDALTLALVFGSMVALVSTVPYALTAIDYRQRDNGLAYLLLVIGVGIWNLMFVAQLLSARPLIKVFFLALSVVGAIQAGIGWFMFATTASSTPGILDRRGVYAAVGVLGGLDIVLAVTAPVHPLYWSLPGAGLDTSGFAVIEPAFGYWLHTVLLVLLSVAGAALFAATWRQDPRNRFAAAYAVAGTATAAAVLGSNLLLPGGAGVAQVVVLSLTTIGWLQASRGEPLGWLGLSG